MNFSSSDRRTRAVTPDPRAGYYPPAAQAAGGEPIGAAGGGVTAEVYGALLVEEIFVEIKETFFLCQSQ